MVFDKSVLLAILLGFSATCHGATEFFTETTEAFRNPMKGFRPSRYVGQSLFRPHEYASIYKHYIPYTSLEADPNDSAGKIRDWCNTAWAGIEEKNVKVIPRVIINYPSVGEWWPSGVPYGVKADERWHSEELKNRLVAFAAKIGNAWDNDSRVAAVEMGLWGYWGEHHIWPDSKPGRIPSQFQEALGQAFASAFKNKKVMVRYQNTFTNFAVGYFWDSFALPDDAAWAIWMQSKACWQTQMISGEVAYNWGDQTNLGGSPNGTLGSTANTDYVINYVRSTHCSSLGWIAEYTPGDGIVSANAAKLQKELGYRFFVSQATFPSRADAGVAISVAFKVTNRGNAPFYHPWSVKLHLLRSDKSVAWSGAFATDIRHWMPGGSYDVSGSFVLPAGLVQATYTLALSVNDPDGDLASLRFANSNYYSGGFTPIGRLGVGKNAPNQNLGIFDQLNNDTSLHYTLNHYDIWAFSHGLIGAAAAGDADPDGDGLKNTAEFAFGGSPIALTGTLLEVSRSGDNATISFLARTTNSTLWNAGGAVGSGVVYQLQSSTNLAQFLPASMNVVLSPNQSGTVSGGFTYQRWEVDVPTDSPTQFYRLQSTITVSTSAAQ